MELNLTTIKEYAERKHVSYEAVRKQISKYKNNELKEHIVKKNKTQYLDDYAVDFLDNRRRENPVILMQENKNEYIEGLKVTIENLQTKVTAQADKISELSNWKAENAVLIARAEQQVLLLEETRHVLEETRSDKATVEADFKRMQEELSKVKEELEAEKQKTWLQKLLKK